ncbi:MAG: ABC transporter permease [Planctomycetota bacterium]|jgi:ribose transport system permease protein|nr:ABC transporter permease [Planctomycetota bacterium]
MTTQARGADASDNRAGGGKPKARHPFAVWLKELPPGLWMLLLQMLVFSAIDYHFNGNLNYLGRGNLGNILVQSAPLMILSFAQTLIVLTQGTDLSLGAQVSLVTVVWVLLANRGVNIYAAAAAGLAAAVAIGSLNGLLVSKGRIPPFIATFGTQNVAMSTALLLTAGSSIYHYHPIFEWVMETNLAASPPLPGFIANGVMIFTRMPVIIAAGAFALTWILLYRTKFGTNIFGLGGNQEALALAGISIAGSYVKTYAYAGFLAGVCGLLTACRVESGQPIGAMGWEFEAVAATLLGGTSLREGRGGVTGTIIGVLFLMSLRNGLNYHGISAMYQNAIIGSIVMLAIVVDGLVRRGRD